MIFTETSVKGAFVIDLEPHMDNRGFFARSFCAREFEAHGLKMSVVQANISFTQKKGTIRGLHYSVPPTAEAKLVRCIKGSIFDVIVDLRRDSPTYLRHFAVKLAAESRKALFVPEMVAVGFQSLTDDVEVHYLMSEFYVPEVQRGLRYDDPMLKIAWPLPVREISERDLQLPFWADQERAGSEIK
jgi:dTDP-4-dehydrorhamnose 3,5-epimerase